MRDEEPPHAFMHIRGVAPISSDTDDLLWFATEIGARYMGADRAAAFGRSNAVPSEILVWVTTQLIAGEAEIAGYGG